MAGNLTAILPLEDLSFPGLADVSYVKLLAALAAFPAVVILLNVLSQLVCALHLTHLGEMSDLLFFSFRFVTRVFLQSFFIGYPS
jgi:hypothetical protein